MDAFQPCSDTSDLTELSLHHRIFLKPEAKISITVALPNVRLPGKTISNWEVMERLRQVAQPDEFQVIKVSKSTLEFIRFDGEIENRSQIRQIIGKLDGKAIRLSGFPEPLKIRAAEAKPEFPTRHDWDRYFRDAKNMNEMKAGERPDTVYVQGLPSKWFVSRKDRRADCEVPSETVLQQVFGVFGDIRCVDIPMLDPYRNKMKASISGIRTFSHETDAMFDAYIQYRDYICFVKAMDSLRGMKLVFRDGEKAFSSSIKVDFDKTKHLTDMSIRRRAVERDKLMSKEREAEEKKRKEEEAIKREMEADERKKVEEKRLKGERRKEREEKRKQRILKKLKKREAEQMNIKIAIEERKLLMAQRKLESIRLLDELFERVKVEKQKEVTKQKESELDSHINKVKMKNEVKQKKKDAKEMRMSDKLMLKEKQLRKKLVNKIKSAQEQQMEERREKLRKTIEGKGSMKTVIKNRDGTEIQANPEYDRYNYAGGYDYTHYDSYGYGGYGDWGHRGGFRGRYFPRRPFRGPRGFRGARGGFYGDWYHQNNSDWQPPPAPATTSAADDMEDVSSDSVSSATSKYSNLGASSDEKEKEPVKQSTWPGYEANLPADGAVPPSHPWVGYSDFYNPRFMRRASRRPGSSFRGQWQQRGSYTPAPNPNVPMNSFYMQSINSQYYRYFNRLTKGDEHDKPSRSRSQSSERVVCRKVLSRSRSRGKSYSRSRSYSRSSSRSRSKHRSRTRSRSKSRKRSRSKSKSRTKSRTRSKSKSREISRSHSKSKYSGRSRSRSKSHAKSRSRSKSRPSSPKVEPVLEEDHSRKNISSPKKQQQQDEVVTTVRKKDKAKEVKSGSELSLSLSGSEDWTRGSPERKVTPLGDPNWEPSDRRYRRGGRNYSGYERPFQPFRYEVRSTVTRPDQRSRSRDRHSRRQESRRSRDKEVSDKNCQPSRSKSPRARRSRSRETRRERSRSRLSDSPNDAPVKSKAKQSPEPKSSSHEAKDRSTGSKTKRKKDKKREDKSRSSKKHKKKSSNKKE